jgi:hypothetical protein
MRISSFSTPIRLFCLLAIAACVFSIQAQSGRRQPKAPAPAPIPTPTPEPTPTPKKESKEPELGFVVGVDRNSTYASFPFSYYDAVLRGCADRLRNGSSARVDVSERDTNRGDAIKRAKLENTTYVVLLRLLGDTMGGNSSSTYDELELEYVVFAPGTAKVVTSGRSYQNANRKGPLIVGPSSRPTSTIYREQLLKHAGEEAGERILKALNLSVPRTN